MIKVGDVIPCSPLSPGCSKDFPKTACVEYIHPQGRYYVIRFDCGRGGSFCETREFTVSQMEEAYRLGVFIRPKEEILYNPSEKRKVEQSALWRRKHRPVEEPFYNDDEDDISTLMAMA